MDFRELFEFLAVLFTVVVFLSGFLSVRVHAHHDRAQQRYDTLIDRAIRTIRETTSYPRPAEFVRIADVYEEELLVDWPSWVTLAVCILAWLIGIGTFAYALVRTNPSQYESMFLLGDSLLLTLVMLILAFDLSWTS